MVETRRFSQTTISIVALSAWLVVLAFLLLPKVILGENSLINPWDNFDSIHAWNMILARTGTMFALWDSQVPTLFDTGVPRVSLGAQFTLQGLIYLVLPPYWTTVAMEIIARAIGFWGMYRLIAHQLFARRPDGAAIAVVAATTFSLVNYMPGLFLTVIGLPLLAAALIAIVQRKASVFDYIYLILFPFASSLALVGLFVIAILGLVCLVFLANREWNHAWRLMAASAVLAVGYGISDYGIIALKLFGSIETQRSLRPAPTLSVVAGGIQIAKSFFTGRYHTTPAVAPWAILLSLIGAAIELIGFVRSADARDPAAPRLAQWARRLPITLCLAVIFALCVLSYLPAILRFYLPSAPLPKDIDLTRWLWLTPPIYYLAFGLAAVKLASLRAGGSRYATTLLCGFLVIPQFLVMAAQTDMGSSLRARLAAAARHDQLGEWPLPMQRLLSRLYSNSHLGLTYREYYSTAVFDKIERMLGRPRSETRIATIGADPFLANYSGFLTTEGYFQLIPLSYHGRIIAAGHREFSRDPALDTYMNEWGNRTYFYSSELFEGRKGCVHYCTADRAPPSITLDYDPQALRALHLDALISVSAITNADQLGLEPVGVAEDPTSPWRFFVYRVKDLKAGL